MTHAEIHDQIEAAFDYRGHVTLTLADGSAVEGYVYNRDLRAAEPYVELFVKNSDERRRIPVKALKAVGLTGEDCAAGKSFEDYQKKKSAEKKA